MRFVFAALCLSITAFAHAEVLRVGPDQTYTRIADAAKAARDGDTVEILPGEYRGDVAVWTQHRLTIRGSGERPVLIADGKDAEGKAIWVIRNGDFHIANIEFRGARVADGNGAGIRLEGGRLEVVDAVFIDNQNGILTANHEDIELHVRDSLFAQAPRQQNPLPHLIYVGRIGHFSISGSRFHGGYYGHLIKSRARRSDIRYNLIYDGPGGEASYEIDLPNAGLAYLIGNLIGQSAATHNPVVVAYGAEGKAWPGSALYLSHNTLLSDYLPGAWFLRSWRDHLPPNTEVVGVNNLTVGLGAFTLAASGQFSGNWPALAFQLGGVDILDFSVPADSLLRRVSATAAAGGGSGGGESLVPTAEFRLPIGTAPLAAPAHWVAGALQASDYAVHIDPTHAR